MSTEANLRAQQLHSSLYVLEAEFSPSLPWIDQCQTERRDETRISTGSSMQNMSMKADLKVQHLQIVLHGQEAE